MLKDILSISGYGGLFKFVSQARNGIIVESLKDKKRMHAYATAKISSLEDIAIFTDDDEVPLAEVMKKIKEKEDGGLAIHHKSSPGELKAYFCEVLPNYDRERVYMSDIKKVINWYNTLQELGMIDFETEEETEEDNKSSAETEPQAQEAEAEKKSSSLKTAGDKEKKAAAPKKDEKPQKSAESKPGADKKTESKKDE